VDDRFFNAFLPPSATICGRRLERFTLWHHLGLSAIGSPILSRSGAIVPRDLLAAVAIIRKSCGKPVSIRPCLLDFIWHWALCRWPDIFRREVESLWSWIDLQSSAPIYYRISRTGDTATTLNSGPQCLYYKSILMAKGGFTEAQAWNMPLGKAMWEVAQIIAIEDGNINFLDEDDLDDSPIDLSDMTEEEALAMFRRDLPTEEMAQATFKHWKENKSC
jgi:hypothetical protein